MSRTKGMKDGYWYYRIYDVDTNELIAEGTQAECCRITNQEGNHYHNIVFYAKNHPNMIPKWERVEREWRSYGYEVTDTENGLSYIGNKEKCRHWMQNMLGKELTDANFINYWYGSVKRFKVIKKEQI